MRVGIRCFEVVSLVKEILGFPFGFRRGCIILYGVKVNRKQKILIELRKGRKMATKKSKKKSKKVAAKKQVKKQTKKSEKKKDSFGSVIGSRNAAINLCLSKKPKKMSQLVKEAKVPGTYYCHCNSLVQSGILVKSKDGFALK